jgi:hypothetical protein
MLLQGDELSVQLFIGAAALTALSVAMTQAGWTHKWFVRGMFGLAGILSVICVGWPYFETRTPMVSGALLAVASTRIGWFFIGVMPAFVGGMLLSDSLRQRRRKANALPTKWMPIFMAMETLARQDLLDRYRYVDRQISDLLDERMPIENRLLELEGDDPEHSAEYAALKAAQDDSKERSNEWITTAEDCSEALRSNIQVQLRRGELLAKGFLAPHVPGVLERIIPTEEWRFLSLDDRGNQAIGPNFEYIALLIGKPGH